MLDLSHIAVAIALEHGADKKRARSFGLLTEELAGYLAEHGFSDGKKHYINVRLVSKGDDLIIRIRDDCRPFNVTEYYKAMGMDHDLEKDLSLAIIMRRAKDVRYASTFGANNLVIRI